jgi:putative transposase
VGGLELAIPRLRQGSYFPSFLEPRRRAEQVPVVVVQEAYVNGVSTRRVDRLVEQLGVTGLSQGPGLQAVQGAGRAGPGATVCA